MTQKFTNLARSRLASALTDTATSATVEPGFGDLFPVADMGIGTSGDWFKAAIQDVTGTVEIVYVRTRNSGDDIMADLLRAQEGTTARAWASGDIFALRLTAGDIQEVLAVDWSTIPEVNTGAAGKTIAIGDSGGCIDTDGGSVTVPSGLAFDTNARKIFLIYNNSASNQTLIQGAGVTMHWVEGLTGNRVMRPRALVTVYQVAADTYVVTGQGVGT